MTSLSRLLHRETLRIPYVGEETKRRLRDAGIQSPRDVERFIAANGVCELLRILLIGPQKSLRLLRHLRIRYCPICSSFMGRRNVERAYDAILRGQPCPLKAPAFYAPAKATEMEKTALYIRDEKGNIKPLGEIEPSPEAEPLILEEFPSYRTSYIGSKRKIIPMILEAMPKDAKSFFDAFGGSNVVALEMKRRGYKVTTNDKMKYSYHIAKAIIENKNVRLSEEKARALLRPNRSRTFAYDHFKGVFFTPQVLALIDSIRSNIDADLRGYERSIALAALGRTCIDAQPFGHFHVTTLGSKWKGERAKRLQDPDAFAERFIENVKEINSLVFDNGQENKALQMDVREALKRPEAKADVVYFDPPYITEFSSASYDSYYHFVEGLMTHWRGVKLKMGEKIPKPEEEEPLTKSNVHDFFRAFIEGAKDRPTIMISYRNKAYPRGREILQMLREAGFKDVRVKWMRHRYALGTGSPRRGEEGDPTLAMEYLFIGRRKG